jgi:hypothetical protein
MKKDIWIVCRGNNEGHLLVSVNKAIDDGYMPHGDMVVATAADRHDPCFYQPMMLASFLTKE